MNTTITKNDIIKGGGLEKLGESQRAEKALTDIDKKVASIYTKIASKDIKESCNEYDER